MNCINKPTVLTSSFILHSGFHFSSDEDEYTTRIPISTNGLTYAYYYDYGSNVEYVNSSFYKNDGDSISSDDNLLEIQLDRYTKTSLYHLMQVGNLYLIDYQLRDCNFLDSCIHFLLAKQNVIFSN